MLHVENNGKVVAGHVYKSWPTLHCAVHWHMILPQLKLYLSGKHGKAVAVFTIVQQEPESRNVIEFFEQLEIICSVLQLYVVFPMQTKKDKF